MTYVLIGLGWLFSLVFALMLVSMVLMGNWMAALALFLLVLLCLPPVTTAVQNRLDFTIHPLLRTLLIGVMLFGFVWFFVGSGDRSSLYASQEVRQHFLDLYDEKMAEWPLPYEDVMVDTTYGQVHVIVSGPEEAPPMLLLHASGVSSWSWKFNAGELGEYYRLYAIDLISDAGKSLFDDPQNRPRSGQDQADLYAEIADQLGVERTLVVGASEGGFIATNYALFYPERVDKLALMGPMGYAGAVKSSLRIMLGQMYPLKVVQDAIFSWAFSDSAELKEEYGEWFPLMMNGFNGAAKVAPFPFSEEERQSLQVPVLFIFGTKDNLVGDPQTAEALVQDIPDVHVEIVEAGHLMGGEIPDVCNQLLLEFFGIR